MTPEKAQPLKKERLLQSLVFLFLIVPSMCPSFFVVRQGNLSFVATAIAPIRRDLAFFLWPNQEGKERIGWRLRGWQDIIGFSAPATHLLGFLRAQGHAEYLLAFLLVTVVAITEEIIFRACLILRLTEVHWLLGGRNPSPSRCQDGRRRRRATVLRRVSPRMGEVLEKLDMPAGITVSGLESDGADRFFCGGARRGKVRSVRRRSATG